MEHSYCLKGYFRRGMLAVRSNATNKAHFIGNWNMLLGTFVQKKRFEPENRQEARACCAARKSGLSPLVCDDRPA
jgi:hypothetical protein